MLPNTPTNTNSGINTLSIVNLHAANDSSSITTGHKFLLTTLNQLFLRRAQCKFIKITFLEQMRCFIENLVFCIFHFLLRKRKNCWIFVANFCRIRYLNIYSRELAFVDKTSRLAFICIIFWVSLWTKKSVLIGGVCLNELQFHFKISVNKFNWTKALKF